MRYWMREGCFTTMKRLSASAVRIVRGEHRCIGTTARRRFHTVNIETMQLREYSFKNLDRQSSKVDGRCHSGPQLALASFALTSTLISLR
jgi:hypothetical protein